MLARICIAGVLAFVRLTDRGRPLTETSRTALAWFFNTGRYRGLEEVFRLACDRTRYTITVEHRYNVESGHLSARHRRLRSEVTRLLSWQATVSASPAEPLHIGVDFDQVDDSDCRVSVLSVASRVIVYRVRSHSNVLISTVKGRRRMVSPAKLKEISK